MKELYKALFEARKEFKKVVKSSENPHFRSKYADLESVLDAVEEALAKHGLMIISNISLNQIETRLVHVETGDSLVSEYPLNPNLTDQQKGSAITYGRRYSIQALLNLVAEDDDGNLASKPTNPPPPAKWDSLAEAQKFEKFIDETSDFQKLQSGLNKFKSYKGNFIQTGTVDLFNEMFNKASKKIGELNA